MFEEEFILNIPKEPETTIEGIDFIDNEEQSELTELPSKDEVITPENTINTEKAKSTGVSTYVSIPDIKEEKQLCNLNMLTIWDKINMWTVFLATVIILILFSKKSFNKAMEKITNILYKYKFIETILFFILTMAIFLHPTFFNSGISGDISFFTMSEFVLFIISNSALLTYIIVKHLKKKNFIFKDKDISFAGISFLKKSMWIFTLTGILFFFFTESKIAYITLYILSFFTLIITFNQIDFTKLNSIKKLIYLLISMQLFLIGSLLGLYLIIVIGSLFIGYYLSNPDENKNLKTIIKNII